MILIQFFLLFKKNDSVLSSFNEQVPIKIDGKTQGGARETLIFNKFLIWTPN